jgi:ABC-type dipeptide/oligopeptide/nickel transport system permease component
MSEQVTFKSNRGGMDIPPAAALYLLADVAYGDPVHSTPGSRAFAKAMLEELLRLARARGYKQSDILHTLLAKNQLTDRVMIMAQVACDVIGGAIVCGAVAKSGLL